MVRRRLGIWIFVAAALVIAGAAIYLGGQRRQSLERVAAELGFRFTAGQHALPDADEIEQCERSADEQNSGHVPPAVEQR